MPISPIPSLLPPKIGGVGCGVALLIMGGLGFLVAIGVGAQEGGPLGAVGLMVIYAVFLVAPGIYLTWLRPAHKKSDWQADFDAAKAFAASCSL